MFKYSRFYLIVMVFFLSSPVYADEKQLGDLKIHPYLSLAGTYSDNIYQSYDNKESEPDFYSTISPGVQLLFSFDEHSLELGGRADIYKYSEFSENDHTDAMAGGALNLNLTGDLSVDISDYYFDSEVPRKWKELEGTEDSYREQPYSSNNFIARTKYAFTDDWTVAAWAEQLYYQYDNSSDAEGSDYNRALYGGSLFYGISDKTDVLLEYNFSRVDYTYADDNDNTNNLAYAGLLFDPTAKLNGFLKLGWAQKKMEETVNNKTKIAAGILEKDYATIAYSTSLGYAINPRNILGLEAYRALEDDTDTNAPLVNSNLSIGYRHIYTFPQGIRVTLNANAGYGNLRFEEESTDTGETVATKKRDDDKLYGSAGVDFTIKKRISIGASYTHVNNSSNFKRYDYNENKGTVGLTASF